MPVRARPSPAGSRCSRAPSGLSRLSRVALTCALGALLASCSGNSQPAPTDSGPPAQIRILCVSEVVTGRPGETGYGTRHLLLVGNLAQKEIEITPRIWRYILSEPSVSTRDSGGAWTCLVAPDAGVELSLVVHADGRIAGLSGPELPDGFVSEMEDHLVGTLFAIPRAIRRTCASLQPTPFERFPPTFVDCSTPQDLAQGLHRLRGDLCGSEVDHFVTTQATGGFEGTFDVQTRKVTAISTTEHIEIGFFDYKPELITTRTTLLLLTPR